MWTRSISMVKLNKCMFVGFSLFILLFWSGLIGCWRACCPPPISHWIFFYHLLHLINLQPFQPRQHFAQRLLISSKRGRRTRCCGWTASKDSNKVPPLSFRFPLPLPQAHYHNWALPGYLYFCFLLPLALLHQNVCLSTLLFLLFQVTTNPESRVGRFSVSRTPEQSLESSRPPAPQTPNGPSDPGQVLSPNPPHRASLPSLNNNSFNNSYISSDNDSEFEEDEDFKREVSCLREK